MDSTLVSDMRSSGFDSWSGQILLTSFFLLCQVLSKTNFPCMYKKTTSTLIVLSFVQNELGLSLKGARARSVSRVLFSVTGAIFEQFL